MKMCDVDINKVSPMMRHYISVKKEYPDIKVAWYSGVQREVKNMNLSDIDYIKIDDIVPKDLG